MLTCLFRSAFLQLPAAVVVVVVYKVVVGVVVGDCCCWTFQVRFKPMAQTKKSSWLCHFHWFRAVWFSTFVNGARTIFVANIIVVVVVVVVVVVLVSWLGLLVILHVAPWLPLEVLSTLTSFSNSQLNISHWPFGISHIHIRSSSCECFSESFEYPLINVAKPSNC